MYIGKEQVRDMTEREKVNHIKRCDERIKEKIEAIKRLCAVEKQMRELCRGRRSGCEPFVVKIQVHDGKELKVRYLEKGVFGPRHYPFNVCDAADAYIFNAKQAYTFNSCCDDFESIRWSRIWGLRDEDDGRDRKYWQENVFVFLKNRKHELVAEVSKLRKTRKDFKVHYIPCFI